MYAIFTYKTGWFSGQMLVCIFQHHGLHMGFVPSSKCCLPGSSLKAPLRALAYNVFASYQDWAHQYGLDRRRGIAHHWQRNCPYRGMGAHYGRREHRGAWGYSRNEQGDQWQSGWYADQWLYRDSWRQWNYGYEDRRWGKGQQSSGYRLRRLATEENNQFEDSWCRTS